MHEEVDVNLVLSSRGEPPRPTRRIILPSMVHGDPPHTPPVVFFSHRWCVAISPRPTRRIFLSSMVHGDHPTPHPSYFSLIDGAWRSPHAPSVVFFSHRWCMASPPRLIQRLTSPSIVRGAPTTPSVIYIFVLIDAWRVYCAPLMINKINT